MMYYLISAHAHLGLMDKARAHPGAAENSAELQYPYGEGRLVIVS